MAWVVARDSDRLMVYPDKLALFETVILKINLFSPRRHPKGIIEPYNFH